MNNARNKSSFDTYKLTFLAILTAIVFILQFFVKIPLGQFTISVSLSVIVLGAAVYGYFGGGFLGAVSGFAILLNGDAALFYGFNFILTVLLVLLKGIASGLAAAFAYKLLKRINTYVAVIVAAILAPIVNTGIFFLGSVLFFFPDIQTMAGDQNVIIFVLIAFIGLNFFIELLLNVLLAPIIVRLLKLIPLAKQRLF
jgi:uncharacterized membrane protein